MGKYQRGYECVGGYGTARTSGGGGQEVSAERLRFVPFTLTFAGGIALLTFQSRL